jgi:hypothetical protein
MIFFKNDAVEPRGPNYTRLVGFHDRFSTKTSFENVRFFLGRTRTIAIWLHLESRVSDNVLDL